MPIYCKADYEDFLKLGKQETSDSDECIVSTRDGLGGLGGSIESIRRKHRRNLLTGTEKLLKALYLKKGYAINKSINPSNNKPYDPPNPILLTDNPLLYQTLLSIEYLKNYLIEIAVNFTLNDVAIIKQIQSTGNDAKHQSTADTNFIESANNLINKIILEIESV